MPDRAGQARPLQDGGLSRFVFPVPPALYSTRQYPILCYRY